MADFRFSDPRRAPKHGLVAVGGVLSTPVLLEAYGRGIFPWFSDGEPPHWWCPDPRAVMTPERLHVSRSLDRILSQGIFGHTWNSNFRRVMEECATGRDDGTWITLSMIEAYCELHRTGHAHSIEVWRGQELAGGLYGVQFGAAFMAESMFYRVTNASKVALILAVRELFASGIELFDVQFLTPHLRSLGAFEIRRAVYLDRLNTLRERCVPICGRPLQ